MSILEERLKDARLIWNGRWDGFTGWKIARYLMATLVFMASSILLLGLLPWAFLAWFELTLRTSFEHGYAFALLFNMVEAWMAGFLMGKWA